MTQANTSRLAPREWLKDLLALFPSSGLQLDDFEIVSDADVPSPFSELLVHHSHMTTTLEAAHRSPVRLHVLEIHEADPIYARRLYLSCGDPGPAVLAGILRMNLSFCRKEVRRDVVAARTPLGRILIENDVLTRVESMAFLRVRPNAALARIFEVRTERTETELYGRLAMIFCDNAPAVELLEIVAPEHAIDRDK